MRLILREHTFLLPEDHALFGNCHASTQVELPDGAVLVAWYAGTREGAGDVAIWLTRCEGGTWRAPVRAFAEHGTPHWNPVLHAAGAHAWLFYKVGTTTQNWTTRVVRSADGGRTWSAPRPLVPGDPTPRGPVKNKLVVLSDGAWLAGSSIETEAHWDAFVDRSEDEGETWEKSDVPIEHHPGRWDGVIQPTLWESPPGHVHMLLRSTRGRIYRSDSTDGGRTWTPAAPTSLPNNNSGLDLAQLADGRLVLACNPVEGNRGRRTPLTLFGSTDDGASWNRLRDLETADGEFSYPAVVAARDGLHVTYTWNRTEIVHCRFDVA